MRKNLFSIIWNHKILLSIALSETGAVRGTTVRSLWFVTLLFVVGYASANIDELLPKKPVLATDTITNAKHNKEIAKLTEEKLVQEEKVKIFAHELGVLQARLDRFDVIGEKLFSNPYIEEQLDGLEILDGKGSAKTPEITIIPDVDELHSSIEMLNERADIIEGMMKSSLNLLADSDVNDNQKPNLWPVIHERSRISSRYGYRYDPFGKRKDFHSGLDIAAKYNAPVVSTANGIVVFAGYRYNYGITVEIRHAGGFSTRYAHMNKAHVKNGQRVEGGDLIGLMGSTGRSTGPHLHFEVLLGDSKIDPLPFVKENRSFAKQRARETGGKLSSLVGKNGKLL